MRRREKKKPLQHSFLIGYLYITALQNERQFHLIYCLTELKLDPKENNTIEMKSTFPFFLPLRSPPPIIVVDSMTKEVFYLNLREHSYRKLFTDLNSQKRHALSSYSPPLSQMSDNV